MSLKNYDPTQADHSESGNKAPSGDAQGDPTAWQQAAKPRAPSSRSGQRARHPVATERRPGYIASHWHGEQSLAQSFWVNNVLLSVPLAMLLTGVMGWISVKGQSLQISAIVTLLGWPLLIAFNLWCMVGAWRAAGEYLRMGGAALWTWLTRLSLAVGTVQLAASLLFGLLPDLGEYWQMARGIDPIGQATLKVSADGHVLQLRGPIGMGDAGRLQRLLEASPSVRRLELASPGGRVFEAEQVVALMGKARYNTRAVGNCESACTLLFLAGRERQLMPGAQLGFHRASTGTYNPVFDELANQELASLYRRIGLPETFISRTVKTPSHSMWYPHSDELVANSLIAALPQTLDVALPAGADAQASDFADALQGSPAWHALNQRYAGTLDRLAARMHSARSSGEAQDEALQALGYAELAPHMPELIASVSGVQRRQYAQLVQAQLKTSLNELGREACLGLLAGQTALRRQLPLDLQVKETAWLIEAAGSAPPRFAPKPATAIELEVMRRTLGAHAPGLLADLWADASPLPSGRAAQGRCEAVIQTLDRAAALPVAQRELAERVMFQRG